MHAKTRPSLIVEGITMFILSLPTALSVTLGIIVASSFSVGLYFIANRLWLGETSAETRRTADNVATRIGVIHAVVIGMMFTSVRVEYNEMIVAIESEASAILRLYHAMGRQGGEKLDAAREHLADYVRFVVDVQWPALRELRSVPNDPKVAGRDVLDRVWNSIDEVDFKPGNLNLKALLDQVEDFRMQRLFDTKGSLLPIFWYIAFIGYLLTLMTLYLPPPNTKRCLLVSFYSSMVAVVLLGIYILTHPYSYAAGISPDIFELMLASGG
jgi:hypothetical protein